VPWIRVTLAVPACVVALVPAPSAAAATVRYASPGGAGGSCAQDSPCLLTTALAASTTGDTVIALAGIHDLGSTSAAVSGVTLEGAAGSRPQVTSTAAGATLTVSSGTLRNLDVRQTGTSSMGVAVSASFATIENVAALATGAGQPAIRAAVGPVTIRSSVARAIGASADAISAESFTTDTTAYLRNVTALAPAPGGIAVSASSLCPVADGIACLFASTATVDAKNLLARGAAADLAQGAGGPITIDHSDYRPAAVAGGVAAGAGNISAEPLLVDAANGDVHQLAGSPTIDAGVADARNGTADSDGDPVPSGSAPDIGADEFPVPPVAGGATGDQTDVQQQEQQQVAPDTTAPVLSGLSFRPAACRAAGAGATLARRAPIGSRLSFALSEPAALGFRVHRMLPGRKAGKKCLKPGARNRRGKPCVRYVAVPGTFAPCWSGRPELRALQRPPRRAQARCRQLPPDGGPGGRRRQHRQGRSNEVPDRQVAAVDFIAPRSSHGRPFRKEEAMKYMLLIHQGDTPTPRDPEAWATLSEDEQKAVYADYQAVSQTPGVTPGVQMDSPETATTVRVQDGRTLTTDGPFVETKEALGGYLFFEADNLDAAIELASRIPAARLGGAVEVRPIMER
jgi:hypothetical protein